MANGSDVIFDVIARNKASQTFHIVGKESDGLGNKLGEFAKKGAAALKTFAVAGAAAANAIAGIGARFALEKSKSDTLLAGQLGVGPAQAKELGKVTGALYTQGWAESTAQAADAVRATIQNKLIDPDAGKAAIEAMSTRTAAAAQLMAEEVGRVSSAVSQMLRTGMAKSAEEAFDLLTVATQRGVNKSEDLLDTLNEYGTQFRQIGLDGPTALGLLSQAIQAGGRDADTAADALKEFAIRAIDGSKLSAQGFRLLGLDAQKMTAQIAQGGQDASDGLATVLARLRAMTDPVKQNEAAVALFGTKAEDLGKALLAFDPSTAVAALGEVSGASDKFVQSQSSAGQRFDAIWKGALTAIADKLLPGLEKIIGKIEDWVNDPAVQQWFQDLEDNVDKVADQLMPMLEGAFKFMMDGFKENDENIIAGIVGLISIIAVLAATFMGLAGVVARVWGFLGDVIKDIVKIAVTSVGVMIKSAALSFGWIPGLGDDLKNAAANFDKFKDQVNASLDGIRDRTIKVNVKGVISKDEAAALILGRRQHGGPVFKGQPVIVGEKRPEVFVPDSNGMILPSVPSGAGGAGGTNVIELRATGFNDAVLGRMFLSWLQGALRGNPGVRLKIA